ncbi:hypothetical protein BDR03DRAFT_952344 [Suillus americanus]|nr:hypothetical protein BDR03DRAFT_952344 [Suillus americanus]
MLGLEHSGAQTLFLEVMCLFCCRPCCRGKGTLASSEHGHYHTNTSVNRNERITDLLLCFGLSKGELPVDEQHPTRIGHCIKKKCLCDNQ